MYHGQSSCSLCLNSESRSSGINQWTEPCLIESKRHRNIWTVFGLCQGVFYVSYCLFEGVSLCLFSLQLLSQPLSHLLQPSTHTQRGCILLQASLSLSLSLSTHTHTHNIFPCSLLQMCLNNHHCYTQTHILMDKLYSSTRSVFPKCMCQGVTFLALGNGAPDVFSATVAFSRPHTAGLAVGALFGTCTHTHCLAIGALFGTCTHTAWL